jgi:hypothetical protein
VFFFTRRALLDSTLMLRPSCFSHSVPGTEAGPAVLQRRRDIPPGKKRARAAGLVAHDRCTLLLTWVPYTFMRTRCNMSTRPRSSCIAKSICHMRGGAGTAAPHGWQTRRRPAYPQRRPRELAKG